MKTHLAYTLLAVSLVSGSGFISPVSAGQDCTCRHIGGETPEGQTACIKTPKGMTMARCERVLNNTSWKILKQACPLANATLIELPLKS